MDVLTRYHRMLGNNADWLPGVDHAAIATEAVLVKQLAQKGLRREDLGREGFVDAGVGVVAHLRWPDQRAVSAAGFRTAIGNARALRWTKGSRPRCGASSSGSIARG